MSYIFDNLFEYYYCEKAEAAKGAVSRVLSWSARNWGKAWRLSGNIDKLKLSCMALWSLFQERLHLTDEELGKRVEEINIRSRTVVEKKQKQEKQCLSCKRIISPQHDCIWYAVFWDYYIFQQLRQINSDVYRTISRSARTGKALMVLEDRIGKLTLISLTIWSILKEKFQLSEDDLFKKIQEIDLKDGKLDGKIQSQVKQCASCKRVMSPSHQKCIWCEGGKLVELNNWIFE